MPLLICTGFFTNTPSLSGKLFPQSKRYDEISNNLLMCIAPNLKKQDAGVRKSILGLKTKTIGAAQQQQKTTAIAIKSDAKLAMSAEKKSGKDSKADKKKIQANPVLSGSISVSSSSKSVSSVQADGEMADSSNLDSLIIDDIFRTAMKDFRKANAPKKLIRAVADYSESGRLDQNMTVHAFRTLQRMNRYVMQHSQIKRKYLRYNRDGPSHILRSMKSIV